MHRYDKIVYKISEEDILVFSL